LEKVTRILTPEEQVIFDKDWVGRDGSKRKLEVSLLCLNGMVEDGSISELANYGQAKAEEDIPI
jgi:hypothetical protein